MENEKVVSLIVPQGEGDILTATENGFGKRTPIEQYPAKSRATKGVVSIKVSERNGLVVGAIQVDESKEIMLISDQGTLVRTRASEVSTVGRNTQGVRLIRTAEDELVVGLQRIDEIEEAEFEEVDGEAAVETAESVESQVTDSSTDAPDAETPTDSE
jgi:DNA gyrase subunit A